MKEKFATLVEEAKTNPESMSELLNTMKPLINSYAKKLFFMEIEDAEQEILLAIIESVKKIPKCLSDRECLTYLNNGVKFKHAYLCKKNIRKEQHEAPYENNFEEIYVERYDDINTMIDFEQSISQLSDNQKLILKYLMLDYSDREISEKIGLSRQYINRIKKKLII